MGRDHGRSPVQDVSETEKLAFLSGQSTERVLKVQVSDLIAGICRLRWCHPRRPLEEGAPPPSTTRMTCLVRRYREEPGSQPLRIAERRRISPEPLPRRLCGITCLLDVSADEKRQTEDVSVEGGDEGGKRRRIPGTYALQVVRNGLARLPCDRNSLHTLQMRERWQPFQDRIGDRQIRGPSLQG